MEVDGRRLSERTPTTVEGLPAGETTVRLGLEEHQSESVTARVPRDGVALAERTLARVPHGTLTLSLRPSEAEATLPDAGRAYRPGVRLPEGDHRVVVRADGYASAERTVRVSGETTAEIELSRAWRAGQRLRDDLGGGGRGPEMAVIPGGTFTQGCASDDCDSGESPTRRVTVAPFALGATEVTFAEWDLCVSRGGCGHEPDDRGWGRGDRPVINVSWEDARAYAAWLSSETGESYRLPSESEWEYAARAGTRTKYWWGDDIGANRANCDGCGSRWDNDRTAPAGSFEANGWGLRDVHGNVWEWVEDCSNGDYEGAPTDGSAWLAGDCRRRVLRGGSWSDDPGWLRAALRDWDTTGLRLSDSGFRVARTLSP